MDCKAFVKKMVDGRSDEDITVLTRRYSQAAVNQQRDFQSARFDPACDANVVDAAEDTYIDLCEIVDLLLLFTEDKAMFDKVTG